MKFVFVFVDHMDKEPYLSLHAAGRSLAAISLMLFFMRLFNFYSISRILGPKVLMVAKMVRCFMCSINAIKFRQAAFPNIRRILQTSTFGTFPLSVLNAGGAAFPHDGHHHDSECWSSHYFSLTRDSRYSQCATCCCSLSGRCSWSSIKRRLFRCVGALLM